MAGPKLAADFKRRRLAGRGAAKFQPRRASPRASPRSRRARCPTRPCSTGCGRSPRPTRRDVEIVPMGIDATQQALLTGAVEGATIREPAVTIVHAARSAQSSSWPSAARCSPTSPARSWRSRAPSGHEPAGRAGPREWRRAGDRPASSRTPTGPRRRSRRRSARASSTSPPSEKALTSPASQVRGRPATRSSRRRRDAGLPGQARLARQGDTARGPVRPQLLRARPQPAR